MAIVIKEKPNYAWLAESEADWCKVCELLKTGQYELVAEFLHEAQIASEHTGNVILANIVTAIRQICLACGQYQTGAEWHRRAYEEAGQHEQELKELLYTLFELVSEVGLPETLAKRAPSATSPIVELNRSERDIHHLWRHIQKLLGWVSIPQLPERAGPTRLIEAPVPPATTVVELPINYSVQVELEKVELGSPSLFAYCLGTFRVYQDDKLITNWSGGKGKTIFKHMVANRSRPILKDILMDLFWRDADPEAARNNLNVAIYGLRQTLRAARSGFPYILFQDECYLLNPAMAIWVDFEEFGQHYEAGQSFERRGKLTEVIREYELAENLYQGDFLEEDPYEDWPILQRESLKDNYLVILERLSRYYLEEKRYTTCIHLCQKILAKDDCREDAHRRLMQCYSRQGQPNLALRQYQLCVEALARTLDVSPAPETVALYNQIREREAI
ncbi:MAG: hypothetical protein HYR94_21415 [Chloroflexi bacterium]|nr:hypothetical protein [Chloroflexota bacterium]